MKKINVFIAALSLLAAIALPISLQAANPTFSINTNIPAPQDGSVTVPIVVSNNPGFAAAGLALTYDPNVLTITGVNAPVPNMPLNQQFQLTTTPGTQWISLASLNDFTGNGVVANVTFNVNPNVVAGTSNIGLNFTGTPDGVPVNSSGHAIGGVAVGGNVSIQSAAAGFNPNPFFPPPPAGEPWPQTPLPPAPNPGPDNSFIGNPYNPVFAANPNPSNPSFNSPVANVAAFGSVPQTGLPGISWAVVGLCVSLVIFASSLLFALWLWRKRST